LGPDSAVLDRATVHTTSTASQGDSYRWRRPRTRTMAAIARNVSRCPRRGVCSSSRD